ncbi:hypothetical protein [Octadecabacter antarcticus]|uniref:hypothetical protein n=1 Tax=Octadecabacter antarcticus TaxID=1217908 RepID=UPI000310094E|nr:hypothetical protein [Octadecabacter antarcticus]
MTDGKSLSLYCEYSSTGARHDDDAPNSAGLSTLFTTFGQFLDHDMVLTPEDHDAGTLEFVGMPHEIAR